MKTKFIVHPGYIVSTTDGDRHYISFTQLCRLYQVNPRDCVDASNTYAMLGRGDDGNAKFFEHLYPKSNGDYPTRR